MAWMFDVEAGDEPQWLRMEMDRFTDQFTETELSLQDNEEQTTWSNWDTNGWEVTEVPGITVIASSNYPISDNPYDPWFDGGIDGSGNYDPTSPPDDEELIEITVNFDRPLTPEEKAALLALAQAVEDATEAINALEDDAVLTLPDGSTITGAELKELWNKTDFAINENGTVYDNGTTRGEADFNYGDPVVSFNISNVVAYAAHGEAGVNFLVLHELGHLTGAAQTHDILAHADNIYTPEEIAAQEQMANDIAAAIANAGGIPYLANPVYGYSGGPLTFSNNDGGGDPGDDPGGDPGSGGGGPGGGGPGGGGNEN